MSHLSKDNQEKQLGKNEETKLSVEEQGGVCQDPNLHLESNESECKAILFRQAGLKESEPKKQFVLYLMFGTGQEIEKQIIKIGQFVKLPHGIPVPFLGISSEDNDNFIFTVPLCGQGCVKFDVNVDDEICFSHLDPNKILVPIADIKKKSQNCLDGTQVPVYEMRLRDTDLPASISFSLLCRRTSKMRIPTKFKVIILTMDEDHKEIIGGHTVEKWFPACFYNTDAVLQNSLKAESENQYSLMPSNGKKILENNHDKIWREIQNWLSFIEWFVINGVLDKGFLKFPNDDGSLTEERKGEILRYLYEAENIFPKLIEALKASLNEELVEFLLQLWHQSVV